MLRLSTLLSLTCTLLAACAGPSTMNRALVPMTERPPALDDLDVFVGTWQGSAEERLAETDEVTRYEGTSIITWEADRRILVERSTLTRNGEPLSYIAVTGWDPRLQTFRTWKFDSHGGVIDSESWWHEPGTNSWHIILEGRETTLDKTLTISDDKNEIRSQYVLYPRGERSRKVASGSASARRIP